MLLTEYVAALFVLGVLVRDCNWYKGRPATHHLALEVLDTSFLVLFRLLAFEDGGNEYLLTLVTARLLWSDWHSIVVPPNHSEEVRNHGKPSCLDLWQSCANSLYIACPGGEPLLSLMLMQRRAQRP